ncbi:GAF domain-containing sensor histidine kinase [Actinokineospora spheciospongiae]|uniref:GAF domain-containing sensor histidine kinase n=1 Tax=Actinokineospora spheciospongiae TaxID=909613 RepID=UPI0011B43F47|nr:histidine kinase [Actinokineospora spheciospongiae]
MPVVLGGLAVLCAVVLGRSLGPLAVVIAVAGPLPWHVVGVFVWWHAPEHPVARRLVVSGALFAVVIAFAFAVPEVIGGPGSGPTAPRVVFGVLMTTLVVRVVHLLASLPDGRRRFAHERVVLPALWLLVPIDAVLAATETRLPLGPVPVGMWVFLLGPVLLGVRYRLLPRDERSELRWMLGVVLLTAVAVVAPLVLASWVRPQDVVTTVVVVLVDTVVVPAALVVAVVRYRMLGADVAVRRSTRYRLSWVFIALWYVGAVAGLSLTASAYLPGGLVVLVAVAATVAAEPVRARLTRIAAARVYGHRPSGQELLVRFGATLEQVFHPSALAAELARTVAEAFDLRWARVTLETPNRAVDMAGVPGKAEEPALAVTLCHRHTVVGSIECGPKVEGALTPSERALVQTLARQTALAVHNLGLAAQLSAHVARVEEQAGELEASRARIVQAQNAERRRVQGQLHDGVQQDLVAMVTRLRLARNQLRRDPDRVDAMLDEVQEDVYRVIAEVRELAHGIHPPELTDQGLAAAVRSRARRAPIPVTVHAGPEVTGSRFVPDVEEAAYFLISEALTNVLKHAEATRATIRLSGCADLLDIEVTDDGVGFSGEVRLTGLRDRVDAVGGALVATSAPGAGATVRVRLPVRRSGA